MRELAELLGRFVDRLESAELRIAELVESRRAFRVALCDLVNHGEVTAAAVVTLIDADRENRIVGS